MKITGPDAAIKYLQEHQKDFTEELDPDIAEWISDGYLEWEPTTDQFHLTATGKAFFHQGTMH